MIKTFTKNQENLMEQEWDSLPNAALVNIFCKISIKDRIFSTPFVCKSWFQASKHPHCWSSMVSESYFKNSSDYAFVKDSHPFQCSFIDPFEGKYRGSFVSGFNAFREVCGRAKDGIFITSVYVAPFVSCGGGTEGNDDAILDLIAQNCPNLKHLSFHGSSNASEEAILKVIQNCTKLELVDFSNSPYFCYSVLEKLSISCPNLRGIRRNGYVEPSFASALNELFPCLQLLNLSNSTISDKDLLTLVNVFKRPLYLDIRHCSRLLYYMHIIKVASSCANNIEIIYD
ncbi:hypothetical protein Leryth_009237 [Lithospermum erythrorhizon]|nr:hypothetical protein Leryth_009237 [Lithospermum erythrorhizon]